LSTAELARQPDGVRRAAAAVFAAIVVVGVVAFLVTQRVKHLPTPIEHFEVAPSLRVPAGRERISLRLAAADVVSVRVVDSEKRPVARLVEGLPLGAGQLLRVRWDGRIGDVPVRVTLRKPSEVRVRALVHGPLAPAGEYQVLVTLQRKGRTIPLPANFILERR